MILGEIDGLTNNEDQRGVWDFDEDDFMLAAFLMDEVYCPEVLWDDPTNHEYGGCYRVRDYQYPMFRPTGNYEGYACARSVGKTESIKAKTFCHAFKRIGENLLITAPEMIHLLPLTDAVEDRIESCRLTREFLKTDKSGKTGFTHRPFGVDYADGTKIVGRIPRLKGTGVKGQHQPDLIIDEAQDYPEPGWVEVHETVLKDHVDADGEPDFTYAFYGVHSGARDGGFFARTQAGGFKIINITALMRPGWGEAEKNAAKAAYGGSSSPDYRRNILGEAGSAASAYFVIARLMACVDQEVERGEVKGSHYNTHEYRKLELRAEEFEAVNLPIVEVLDLPSHYKRVWGGMDIGLTESPTVLSVFSEEKVGNKSRLKLVRLIKLQRFRPRHIREALYALALVYGPRLQGVGIDATGLGYPIFQDMEDDEDAPQHILDVTRGYKFNAKVPVGVDEANINKNQRGDMIDQFGSAVKIEHDPLTGRNRYVTYMAMIEASTRYLREMVDSTFLQLPFDPEITKDMMAETQQRVRTVGQLTGQRKPQALHILDSFRGMAMSYKAGAVDAVVNPPQRPVLAHALDVTAPL